MTFFSRGCFPGVSMWRAALLAVLSIYTPDHPPFCQQVPQFSAYPLCASQIPIGLQRACAGSPTSHMDIAFYTHVPWGIDMCMLKFVSCFLYISELLNIFFCFFTNIFDHILTLPQNKRLGEWKPHLLWRETKLFLGWVIKKWKDSESWVHKAWVGKLWVLLGRGVIPRYQEGTRF